MKHLLHCTAFTKNLFFLFDMAIMACLTQLTSCLTQWELGHWHCPFKTNYVDFSLGIHFLVFIESVHLMINMSIPCFLTWYHSSHESWQVNYRMHCLLVICNNDLHVFLILSVYHLYLSDVVSLILTWNPKFCRNKRKRIKVCADETSFNLHFSWEGSVGLVCEKCAHFFDNALRCSLI